MTIPFIIGLLSAAHCFGMCGGIVGALTMSLAPEVRERNSHLFFYSLAYNAGRITSYATAGILAGWLGGTLVDLIAPEHGLPLLRIVAAIIVILLGLYLLQAFLFGAVWGWLPCGLVYYALLLAVTEGNAIDAGLYMLMFGLGTLIPMLLASMLAGRLNHWRKSRIIQRISGGLLILMGLISLLLLYNPQVLHSLHFMPGKVHLHEIEQ